MSKDKIFLDGTFDPEWYESKVQSSMNPIRVARKEICSTHKPVDLSYTKKAIWADAMNRRGIHQSQCKKCKHWFFPEEM